MLTNRTNYSELCVIKTNLMHCLFSVYFVTQPLHVSGIFVAQDVYSIYTTTGTCCIYTVYTVYSLPLQIRAVADNQRKFKIALNNFLHTYSFYSIEECLNKS